MFEIPVEKLLSIILTIVSLKKKEKKNYKDIRYDTLLSARRFHTTSCIYDTHINSMTSRIRNYVIESRYS